MQPGIIIWKIRLPYGQNSTYFLGDQTIKMSSSDHLAYPKNIRSTDAKVYTDEEEDSSAFQILDTLYQGREHYE